MSLHEPHRGATGEPAETPDPRLRAALRHAPDAGLRAPELLSARILAGARQAAGPRPSGNRHWLGWSGLGTAAAAVLASAVLWVGRDELPQAPAERMATAPAPTVASPANAPGAAPDAATVAAAAPLPAAPTIAAPAALPPWLPRHDGQSAVAPAVPPAPPQPAGLASERAPGRGAAAVRSEAVGAAPSAARGDAMSDAKRAPAATASTASGAAPENSPRAPASAAGDSAAVAVAAAPLRAAPPKSATAPHLLRLPAGPGTGWRLVGGADQAIDAAAEAQPWLAGLQTATAGRWQQPDADAEAATATGAGALTLSLRRDERDGEAHATLRLGGAWIMWCLPDGSACSAARIGETAVQSLRAALPRPPR